MPSVRVKGITAKIESTYGGDASPTPADDGIQVAENFFAEMTWGYLEENRGEDYASGGMGVAGSISPSGRWARIPLVVPLKGVSGGPYADGNRPEWDVLARIGGLSATVDATPGSEAINYKPRSDGFESATVYAYAAGLLYKLVGCHATLSLEFTPNRPPMLRAEVAGILDGDPTSTALPAITYKHLAVPPPIVRNSAMTINGYGVADFDQFDLDMQTVMAEKGRGNAAKGHAGYEITNWDPAIQTRIDIPPLGTFDPFALAESATLVPVNLGPIGSVDYNRIQLVAGQARVAPFDNEEADLLGMFNLTLEARNTAAGNDAFSLTAAK